MNDEADENDAQEEPAPEMEPELADPEEAEGEDAALEEALPESLTPNDLSDGPMVPESASKSTAFMGVPIEVIISVGKARPLVSDLVNLKRDSVITLDSKIDDPVEIFIGDRLIARGELQEMENDEGQLGVRLTEVADLSNGV